MTKMSVEIEGSVDEVIGVLRRLGIVGRPATASDADRSTEKPGDGVRETTTAAEAQEMAVAHEVPPGQWTETLAHKFLSGLQPAARQMALHVWRAGAAGIHRSSLCLRTELTPAELRSTLMRMGHALARFQRERGMTLARPVAANSPLQSYCVDPDFAAVASAQMFGERTADRLADGEGRPWRMRIIGRLEEPTAHRLLRTPLLIAGLWIALACGLDSDDRMVRRYARCLADANTALHRRLTASGAVGTVVLSAEAMEERCGINWSGGRSPWRRSGPTTPATANRCGREFRKWRRHKVLGLGVIRYQQPPGPNCIAFIPSMPSLIER